MTRRQEITYHPGLMSVLAKSRVVFAPEGETGTGTEETRTQENTNNGNNQNNNNNIQDNNDNFDKLWQDEADNTDQGKKSTTQQQTQPENVSDNSTQFNDYIATINFMEGVDLPKIAEELNTGKTDSMQDAFTKVGQNAYKRALADGAKIMDHKISQAVEQAVQKAGVNVNANMAVSTMEQRLGYTKDPAMSPIAKAVLAQLMKKGKSLDDAVQGVDKYFARTAQLLNKNKNAPHGRPGNRGFNTRDNNNVQSDDGDEEDLDWMELLQAN